MQNKNYLIGGLCCLLAAGGFMAYQGGAMNNGPVSFLTQSVDEDPQTLEIFSKLNELQGEEREVLEKELREKYGEKFDEIVKISGEQSKESIIKYTCSEGACIAKPGGQYISSNCNNMCGSTTSSTTSNTTAGSTTNGGGSSGGGPSTTSSNSSISNSTTSSSAGSSSSSNTTSINTSAGSTSVGSTNNGGTVGGGVVGGVDMNGTTTSANTPLIKYLCNGTTKLLEKHVDQPGWPVDGSCSSNMDLRHVCSSTDPNLAGTVCNNGNNVDPNPTNNCSLHHYRCETNGLVAEVNSSTIGFGNCSSTMQIEDLCSSFDVNLAGIVCHQPSNFTPRDGNGVQVNTPSGPIPISNLITKKYTIMDFSAARCSPCRNKAEGYNNNTSFQAMINDPAKKCDFIVIAEKLNDWHSKIGANTFVGQHSVEGIPNGNLNAVAASLGLGPISGIPHVVIVDEQGNEYPESEMNTLCNQ